jgi:membrane protease YdiL (CAAX protease family)
MVLAVLREWRGSLIAPITCHFLHNATISLVTVAMIGVLDG